MGLDLQYDLSNDTPADASPVESNFNRIEQYINLELVNRSGTVAMAAQLKLIGNPVADLDAAPKDYVDGMMPVAAIMMYGGAGAPAGTRWALCNGAELDPALYPVLYDRIGTTYGGTAGKFNLPNLMARFPVGAGTNFAQGATGGSADAVVIKHNHSITHNHASFMSGNNTPSHYHTTTDHKHSVNITTQGQLANHSHAMKGVEGPAGGAVSAAGLSRVIDYTDGAAQPVLGKTGVADAGHTHNVIGDSGYADRTLTTGNESAVHKHAIDMPQFTGNSTDTGVVGTNLNLPPYVVVQFIMRVQ